MSKLSDLEPDPDPGQIPSFDRDDRLASLPPLPEPPISNRTPSQELHQLHELSKVLRQTGVEINLSDPPDLSQLGQSVQRHGEIIDLRSPERGGFTPEELRLLDLNSDGQLSIEEIGVRIYEIISSEGINKPSQSITEAINMAVDEAREEFLNSGLFGLILQGPPFSNELIEANERVNGIIDKMLGEIAGATDGLPVLWNNVWLHEGTPFEIVTDGPITNIVVGLIIQNPEDPEHPVYITDIRSSDTDEYVELLVQRYQNIISGCPPALPELTPENKVGYLIDVIKDLREVVNLMQQSGWEEPAKQLMKAFPYIFPNPPQ